MLDSVQDFVRTFFLTSSAFTLNHTAATKVIKIPAQKCDNQIIGPKKEITLKGLSR